MNNSMSVPEMFRLVTGHQQSWGVAGYNVPKKYEDPQLQKKKKVWAVQKKGGKPRNHITKRGHYIDDILKVTKPIPAPNAYTVNARPPIKQRILPILKKLNFVEQIFRNAERTKSPSPFTYSVMPTDEQIKAKIAKLKAKGKPVTEQKTNFVDHSMSCSIMIPGPGAYNPRQIMRKIRPEPSPRSKGDTGKSFLAKSSTESEIHPYPMTYRLFGKDLDTPRKEPPRKYWGTERRFIENKDKKKKEKDLMPSPAAYEINATWLGKEEGMKNIKRKPWFKTVSTGIEHSVYH